MSIVNFEKDVCALTDKGLVRPHNEDSNQVERTNNGDLFVVCDGMGGHVGGATASRLGVDSICRYVREHECEIPQQFLIRALKYANERIFAESRANSNLRGMGTTACVALVRDDKVWYAHVGDSRIYYYNAKKNALFRLTKDHSVVQALVDQGVITEMEAEHHPEKNKIRKSLGIRADVEPEPCQMPLIPSNGDILLICSDGLSGMMDEDDMLEILSATPNVNVAGKELVELAKAGGGTDNITVQIIKFSGIEERDALFDAKNKGVYGNEHKKEHPQKRKNWLWWGIALLPLLLIVSCAILLLSPSKDKDKIVENVVTNVTVEDAYLQFTHNIAPIETEEDGHVYLFYILEKRSDDMIKGVRVRKDTKTFEIGFFKKQDIYMNGKSSCIYTPYNDIKKYNRDGKEIK